MMLYKVNRDFSIPENPVKRNSNSIHKKELQYQEEDDKRFKE